ncbi:uncharacterized protein CMC5_029760 [Chondromyces crocatus]|uniref:Uncharacterized protein n=1 Tax=Chondromyces crocatus TaxID=52 RepID=A0A0K1ED79_CHOCO|nr:uncharacterized protein CMC5_029760 [Chondromyces crocatus]
MRSVLRVSRRCLHVTEWAISAYVVGEAVCDERQANDVGTIPLSLLANELFACRPR